MKKDNKMTKDEKVQALEYDAQEDVNNEWDKLIAHIREKYPNDFRVLKRMSRDYKKLPKNLFEQGYRSGFNSGAKNVIKQLTSEGNIVEVHRPMIDDNVH